MMSKRDDLFDLIQAMSKNEKRYVKVIAFQHSGKNQNKYIQLFDLIHKQKTYNEKEIKSTITDKMLKKNFAVEKNYLYNFLLKSITSYHGQKSLDAKAANSLYTIKLLNSKALYRQSIKLIEKTIKFAEQNENFTLLLELLKLKTNYYEITTDWDAVNKTFQRIFEVQKIYTNLEEFRYLHHKIYEQIIQLGNKDRGLLIKKVDKFINNSILKKEEFALSNEAKIRFNECWMLYYYLKADYVLALKNSKRAVVISENSIGYLTERRDRYLSHLNNYVIFCNALKEYQKAEEQIQKIRSFLTKDVNDRPNISCFVNLALQETNLFLSAHQFEKIYDVIDEYDEYLILFEDKILPANKYGLNVNLSILFFINEDYKTALKWINNIILDKEPEIRSDIVDFAWIFSLIIHYELENYDYLDYLTKTTINLLSKRNRLVETSKILSKHLLKMTISSANERKEIYQSLDVALQSKKSQKELKELEFFDITHWVKSKMDNTSMKEIIRKN